MTSHGSRTCITVLGLCLVSDVATHTGKKKELGDMVTFLEQGERVRQHLQLLWDWSVG